MLPIDPVALFGKVLGYGVYLLVGIGFGAVLEMSGFGDSRKLSAQFYFRDMTVLKVMFGAIVVAMVLIFAGSALGMLDFNRVYVNQTYLWPQIVGGLIMGLGFIIGGFCPGTSLVAMATLKLDGVFFVGGVFAGVWVFGEVVSGFEAFYESGFLGRFTLFDWLRVDAGWIVLVVVLMAVGAFAAAGWAEKRFGKPAQLPAEALRRRQWRRRGAALTLIAGAVLVWLLGQPGPGKKWQFMAASEEGAIRNRQIYAHPAEVVELMHNPQVYLRVLDIRSESDFNLFHLEDARHVSLEQLRSPHFPATQGVLHANTVTVVTGNGEEQATEAYRLLRGHGTINAYVLEGGINRWLEAFPPEPGVAVPLPVGGQDTLLFRFRISAGETIPSARPTPQDAARCFGGSFPHRVKLQTRKVLKGGCG